MEQIYIYYYSFLLMILLAGIGYYLLSGISSNYQYYEHYIGVNLTKDNNTCKLIWLGGWDYESFYTNVTVNGVNVGHPAPWTTIYNDTCKDLVVKMYEKPTKYYQTVFRYNHTGGI